MVERIYGGILVVEPLKHPHIPSLLQVIPKAPLKKTKDRLRILITRPDHINDGGRKRGSAPTLGRIKPAKAKEKAAVWLDRFGIGYRLASYPDKPFVGQ